MSEKTSMNLEVIKVKLHENSGKDIMVFEFPDKEINVNLNETSGQKDFKIVFENLLKRLNDMDIELELSIDDQYKKVLYKEVCNEYISELNKEIKQIREEIEKL